DDNIVADLVTPYRFSAGQPEPTRFVGGLLGQWAVWTHRAVTLLDECHRAATSPQGISPQLLATGIALTDANAVIFDAVNDFHGCIPGIHEILRRQGLLEGIWCLEEHETLS